MGVCTLLSHNISHHSFHSSSPLIICIYCLGGKVGRENVWRIILFKHLAKKVWRINRSAEGLLIVTTTLDGFSLVNRQQPFYPPNFPTIRHMCCVHVCVLFLYCRTHHYRVKITQSRSIVQHKPVLTVVYSKRTTITAAALLITYYAGAISRYHCLNAGQILVHLVNALASLSLG